MLKEITFSTYAFCSRVLIHDLIYSFHDTVCILALGMANVIGALSIIGHNVSSFMIEPAEFELPR